MINARVAQLVEHDLAKVGAAGSSPVSRSKDSRKLESFFYCIFGHSRTFGHSGNHRFRVGTGGNQNQVETGNEHYDNLKIIPRKENFDALIQSIVCDGIKTMCRCGTLTPGMRVPDT